MIIVSMGAGLGNQMYEYAFYTRLKILYPAQEIKVDTRYAFPYAHNGIEVFDIFGLSAPQASLEEVLALTRGYRLNGQGFEKNGFVKKIKDRLKKKPETMLIQNDFTVFDETLMFHEKMNAGISYYLFGPFANYHYFKDIEDEIKKLYVFPRIEDENNQQYARQIEQCNSVSIHVRKGDYIKENVQLTPKLFYEKATKLVEDQTGKCKFFVFTDDKSYARELFPNEDRFIIVNGNTGKNSYRDMQLMSMCNHNITANSTFSFWGAFLNNYRDKIVVAPNLPFSGCKCPFVCDDWIIL